MRTEEISVGKYSATVTEATARVEFMEVPLLRKLVLGMYPDTPPQDVDEFDWHIAQKFTTLLLHTTSTRGFTLPSPHDSVDALLQSMRDIMDLPREFVQAWTAAIERVNAPLDANTASPEKKA